MSAAESLVLPLYSSEIIEPLQALREGLRSAFADVGQAVVHDSHELFDAQYPKSRTEFDRILPGAYVGVTLWVPTSETSSAYKPGTPLLRVASYLTKNELGETDYFRLTRSRDFSLVCNLINADKNDTMVSLSAQYLDRLGRYRDRPGSQSLSEKNDCQINHIQSPAEINQRLRFQLGAINKILETSVIRLVSD